MSPKLALVVFGLFIFWLFVRDRKRHPGVSSALWIPVLWLVILGSRPFSMWSNLDIQVETSDSQEGSPTDRLVFLALMVGGVLVLFRKRVDWSRIISENRWLFVFYLYLGISVLWSDFAFVSFKRWVKDLGNVVMVLVILSEDDPIEAVGVVLGRCCYILVPLSVLFIKYFPDVGRYIDSWTWQYHYGGVTTNKNILGMTLFVCGLFLCWRLLRLREEEAGDKSKLELLNRLILVAMTFYLLHKAQSSTALACTALGISIILGMRVPFLRSRVKWMGVYAATVVLLVLLLQWTVNLGQFFVASVGRDMTFTGRTQIWQRLLNEEINPLIGVGFYSFWLGDRVQKLSEGFWYQLNEAHNGYLETYLNSGLIGVFLLAIILLSGARRVRDEVSLGSSYAALRLAFIICTAVYNITEAGFNRLGLVWFVLLLMLMEYPRPVQGATEGLTGEMPDH